MTIRDLLTGLRLLAAVGLLVLAGIFGMLSTLLLDMNNFRTEGSPAGTGMFVVALVAPVGALGSLGGALLLFGIGWFGRRHSGPGSTAPAPVPRPARREEIWRIHASGASLGALINGELAVLLHLRPDGSAATRSHNASYRGSPTATYPFRCADGALVQVPTLWTVPTALALRALEHFAAQGECAPFLGWEDLPEADEPATPAAAGARAWHSALARA
jgi:hypothetical protein